jgi:Mlc titration factor MtfA (ptsG expression regulator)
MPKAWQAFLDEIPFYETLYAGEGRRLRDIMRVIIAEKNWEGCGGQVIDDRMRVVVAAQAALLLLNIEHQYYRQVTSIIIYPSSFVVPDETTHVGGMVTDSGEPVLGLAVMRGPVVLSWRDVLGGVKNDDDGRNVVLHEFAHRLDMLDGYANGAPVLGGQKEYEAWARIMNEEYDRLVDAAQRGRRTVLDKYGATDPAEFFAVVTECFFEKPAQMKKRHAELYELLCQYYHQDPEARR